MEPTTANSGSDGPNVPLKSPSSNPAKIRVDDT